jgi:superfamily II DNA or RNA helicase
VTCRPELSDEQEAAVEALRAWARDRSGPADARSLRGLAGTGKTVAAAELVARLAEDGQRMCRLRPASVIAVK